MTLDPVVLNEGATVDDVVTESHVAQVPVVCVGRIIRVVSRSELIAALERSLGRN